MKNQFVYLLMMVGLVFTASCSSELEDPIVDATSSIQTRSSLDYKFVGRDPIYVPWAHGSFKIAEAKASYEFVASLLGAVHETNVAPSSMAVNNDIVSDKQNDAFVVNNALMFNPPGYTYYYGPNGFWLPRPNPSLNLKQPHSMQVALAGASLSPDVMFPNRTFTLELLTLNEMYHIYEDYDVNWFGYSDPEYTLEEEIKSPSLKSKGPFCLLIKPDYDYYLGGPYYDALYGLNPVFGDKFPDMVKISDSFKEMLHKSYVGEGRVAYEGEGHIKPNKEFSELMTAVRYIDLKLFIGGLGLAPLPPYGGYQLIFHTEDSFEFLLENFPFSKNFEFDVLELDI